MSLAGFESNDFSFAEKLFLASQVLNADLSFHHGYTFFLLKMHMHRRAGIGLNNILNFQVLACSIIYTPYKGEFFTSAIFNCVRVSKLSHVLVGFEKLKSNVSNTIEIYSAKN